MNQRLAESVLRRKKVDVGVTSRLHNQNSERSKSFPQAQAGRLFWYARTKMVLLLALLVLWIVPAVGYATYKRTRIKTRGTIASVTLAYRFRTRRLPRPKPRKPRSRRGSRIRGVHADLYGCSRGCRDRASEPAVPLQNDVGGAGQHRA